MTNIKIYIVSILTGFILSITLNSCESKVQSANSAFEQIQEDKKTEKDSIFIIKEVIQEPKKIKKEKAVEMVDGWTLFKMEMENTILQNESLVKELKSIPNTNSKLLKKITYLEKDNNDLRKEIDDYKLAEKNNLEIFQSKLRLNANDIKTELVGFEVNNKKAN